MIDDAPPTPGALYAVGMSRDRSMELGRRLVKETPTVVVARHLGEQAKSQVSRTYASLRRIIDDATQDDSDEAAVAVAIDGMHKWMRGALHPNLVRMCERVWRQALEGAGEQPVRAAEGYLEWLASLKTTTKVAEARVGES